MFVLLRRSLSVGRSPTPGVPAFGGARRVDDSGLRGRLANRSHDAQQKEKDAKTETGTDLTEKTRATR